MFELATWQQLGLYSIQEINQDVVWCEFKHLIAGIGHVACLILSGRCYGIIKEIDDLLPRGERSVHWGKAKKSDGPFNNGRMDDCWAQSEIWRAYQQYL